ncbi:MAG: hypothetical protein AVDCRST_MAG49-1240 [uncultured Thermomicrobiales bacterium]|uniref:Putative zinc-ribbon domain-containing protein n=1 Tax=uncultured Thermomicrobiales bacterium TaxID=1645740 RepID=A0A6J4UBF9_9BACT|nr:MAG: hypothetical protein AVDCRST_MAG49-1240 [uncultured Thermomicrobiales bacterium]
MPVESRRQEHGTEGYAGPTGLPADKDPVCAMCGKPVRVDDIVCPHCGASLVAG